MLTKGPNDRGPATRGEGDDPDSPVFSTPGPSDQAFLEEPVHRDTDRTRGQIYDWADRIDGQRPLMQQDLQHAEVRFAEPGIFNSRHTVAGKGTHRLDHDKPHVIRILNALDHKTMNPSETYII